MAVNGRQGVIDERSSFVTRYDEMILDASVTKHYRDSGFFNVGYWNGDIREQIEACRRLVDELLDTFPDHTGRILDVACGLGATTRRLTRHYPPRHVVGINISTRQLERCRELAPDCDFRYMDATALDFPAGYFDRILCVEAAFHFDTRADFLGEAYRVLRPGGWIAISDLLVDDIEVFGESHVPEENRTDDLDAYRQVWRQAGFGDLSLVDATEPCWKGYCDFMIAASKRDLAYGADRSACEAAVTYFENLRERAVKHYVLVTAQKQV